MKQVYQEGMTFKITSKRSDHSFELDSRELNQILGDAVFEAIPNVQVKMKAPDIELRIEIREEAAYISYETIRGAGGLPVGTSGKGMLMLSGGIDSVRLRVGCSAAPWRPSFLLKNENGSHYIAPFRQNKFFQAAFPGSLKTD